MSIRDQNGRDHAAATGRFVEQRNTPASPGVLMRTDPEHHAAVARYGVVASTTCLERTHRMIGECEADLVRALAIDTHPDAMRVSFVQDGDTWNPNLLTDSHGTVIHTFTDSPARDEIRELMAGVPSTSLAQAADGIDTASMSLPKFITVEDARNRLNANLAGLPEAEADVEAANVHLLQAEVLLRHPEAMYVSFDRGTGSSWELVDVTDHLGNKITEPAGTELATAAETAMAAVSEENPRLQLSSDGETASFAVQHSR